MAGRVGGGRLAVPQDPKFINYLFTLKRYDCHFIVWNPQLSKPETIGVVPVMLMAHSEVLQSEMFCREVEDKKCVTVTDIYPDTFRNLLRYVYGYDNTDTLSFDEADNLLYAADKYLIDSLTSRLVNRLVKMLNPDNICSLLNNPACYRQLELDSAITNILQLETKRVLDSPQFLELTSDALVKVFEQELIAVKEIEVWRAAVKWAKQQAKSDNGQDLRKALEGPAKHIRVCTIDDDSFVKEMSLKRKKLRALLASMPTELGEVGHRLRHHGKHHQGELWRTTTVSEVLNTTTAPALDKASVCYTTNEVLLIIGLTCVLNLAFIAVVMSCVHFCSSATLPKMSRLVSLILVDNMASDCEFEELGRKQRNVNLSSVSGRHTSYQYLTSLQSSLQVGVPFSRSSSMVSLQTLLAPSPPRLVPRHRLEAPGSSLSMENLLFL